MSERQGEYVEEEVKLDMDPLWIQVPVEDAPPPAYAVQLSYVPDFEILDTTPLLDGTDVESQDSGIGGARSEEIDIKEHGAEGCTAPKPPDNPTPRDPRTRRVAVAGPSSLYGITSTPMIDPENIASIETIDDIFASSDDEDRLTICLEGE